MTEYERKIAWMIPTFAVLTSLITVGVLVCLNACSYRIQNTLTHGANAVVEESPQVPELKPDPPLKFPFKL